MVRCVTMKVAPYGATVCLLACTEMAQCCRTLEYENRLSTPVFLQIEFFPIVSESRPEFLNITSGLGA
jgi:hypothetical protein